MAIFNATAPIISISGGGLEYETGAKALSSSGTSLAITFANTHTTAPVFAMALNTSTSTSTTTLSYLTNYNKLLGINRGGNSSYYGQCVSLRGTTSTTAIITNYSSSTISNVLTTTGATFTASSNYPFNTTQYKWIAIWAPEN